MNQSKTIEGKELLRLTTAGSVDDGKSTLIGRLLYETGNIFEDQWKAAKKVSLKSAREVDFSLLADGLTSEREQGITIDVAYLHLMTKKRKFIISDVPGHEQYTRNMVTGSSTANIALILVDVQKGLTLQSKRHLFIASLLGIPHIAILINKIDRADYSERIYLKIKKQCENFASRLHIQDIEFIPVSALFGDMVTKRSNNLNWYQGPTLLSYLDNLYVGSDKNLIDFRLPVQIIIRGGNGRRYVAGQVASGILKKGEKVAILTSGKISKVKKIMTPSGDTASVFAGQPATIELEDQIDVSRGDFLVRPNNLPTVSNSINASICWLGQRPLKVGQELSLKLCTQTVRCEITGIKYKIEVDNLHRKITHELKENDIGRIYLKSHKNLKFDPFEINRECGSFILIDENTKDTVAAGLIKDKTETLDDVITNTVKRKNE